MGWTPVIGFDPRSGPPTVLPGSILIDFNSHFWFSSHVAFHFPLEFASPFRRPPRILACGLLLCPGLDVMHKLKSTFESLPDGAIAAVPDYGGRRNLLRFRHHRYWELAGCTTRSASESQFKHGSGWWRNIKDHPQCTDEKERRRRARYYYDSGVGIMYWKRHYGGQVIDIPEKLVGVGHCTSINRKNYRAVNSGGTRYLGGEIDLNFDIEEVAARLGIAHLL